MLILGEATHLDLPSTFRLEQVNIWSGKTCVIVFHDGAFLDRVRDLSTRPYDGATISPFWASRRPSNLVEACHRAFQRHRSLLHRLRDTPMQKPSWGQGRALFARFAMRQVNLLILNEPTNHLDTEAIDEVIRTVNCFYGAVLAVSHNREFLEALENCNKQSEQTLQ